MIQAEGGEDKTAKRDCPPSRGKPYEARPGSRGRHRKGEQQLTGFERLDLAESIAEALQRLGEHIGIEKAVEELCDCLDDEALVRAFQHMTDTLAEGFA